MYCSRLVLSWYDLLQEQSTFEDYIVQCIYMPMYPTCNYLCMLDTHLVFLSWSLIFFSISASVSTWMVGPHCSASASWRTGNLMGGRGASLQRWGIQRHVHVQVHVQCMYMYVYMCMMLWTSRVTTSLGQSLNTFRVTSWWGQELLPRYVCTCNMLSITGYVIKILVLTCIFHFA